MIIPSIDLQGGQAVQLVGGKRLAIEAGDPRPIARRFGRVGEVAVIDLDAALGTGSNRALIRELLPLARCRVGGGIRTLDDAIHWLDAGAERVILGTRAVPEILRHVPRERVIAALDQDQGDVVVEGWTRGTGQSALDRIAELRPFVGGFLVTFVEREGRMEGTDLEAARAIVLAAGDCRVTFAGGITTPEEIAELDHLGADAQVGMALYSGRLGLAEAFAAPLKSDRLDGLWPTVVCDESGAALGLAYSDHESLARALEDGVGAYHSRKRGLWIKGETSGDTQELLRIDADCDRDTLRFTVRQTGPFCHTGSRSCWGDSPVLRRLCETIEGRRADAEPGSYTKRLLDDPELLRSKLLEEAGELAAATNGDEAEREAADLLYFALVKLLDLGGTLAGVEQVLDQRSKKLVRRPGDAKEVLP